MKHFNKIVILRSMKGHTQERSHLPAPSGFFTRPMKEPIVRKPIIANNVTRNLPNIFPRKSKKPFYCKQCGENFSYLLFLQKRDAKFLVTLFAMKGFVTKVFFHGYGEKSTRSRQTASLLCVSFHASSNHNFVEMLYHTWNM